VFDQQITFIYVSDLGRSALFYEQTVGLELVLVQPAGCRIYRSSGSSYLGLCRNRPDRQSPGDGLVLCLVTADVDNHYARISAAGADCDGAPRLNETYGIYHFYFRDPDGHLLEVQRFEDPAWAGER